MEGERERDGERNKKVTKDNDFQEEGVLNMILDTIDKFSQMEALPDFAGLIGEDTHVGGFFSFYFIFSSLSFQISRQNLVFILTRNSVKRHVSFSICIKLLISTKPH